MLEFSDTEKNKIATALQLLHTSAIGATVIDLAVQNPNTGLRIFQSNPPLPGISQAYDSSELNVVGVNPADIDQLYSFNAAGTFGQEQLALILFHEMNHATLHLDDLVDANGAPVSHPTEALLNQPGFDHNGPSQARRSMTDMAEASREAAGPSSTASTPHP
jgi:hypothetical protein